LSEKHDNADFLKGVELAMTACYRDSSLIYDNLNMSVDNLKAFETYKQVYGLKRLNKNHKRIARLQYAYHSLFRKKSDK